MLCAAGMADTAQKGLPAIRAIDHPAMRREHGLFVIKQK
jgi:hypothetical protein